MRAVVWCALLAACGTTTVPEPAQPEPAPDAVVADAQADDGDDAVAVMLAEAGEAYNEGRYPEYIGLMEQVVADDGDNDVALYNLACGYALDGRTDEAITALERLLARKADFGAAQDPDFRSLRDDPRFVALNDKFAALFPTVATSQVVVELDTFELSPEGMAWDAGHERYFVSSMAQAKVVAVDSAGNIADFATVDADGLPLGVLGLEVHGGLLYAVGTHFQQVDGFQADRAGTTGVFVFDLDSGERKRALMRPGSNVTFGFNDLAVSDAGDVYLSGQGGLWHIPSGSDTPQKAAIELKGTNGITFGADQDTLYVSTEEQLLRVNVADMTATPLTGPEGETIAFFDGMYYTDGSLAGIQLGQRWRAVQLTLDEQGGAVTNVRVLEQSNPKLTGATTGALVGDELHYLARRRPTDAELEDIPELARGLANKPVLMRAPLETGAAVTQGD